jgi:transcriptional regulator
MYLPAHFKEERLPVLHGLIQAHPLATLVTLSAEGLVANHIPLLLDAQGGPHGRLVGHVARANPLWKDHRAEVEPLAVFTSADAYISPSFYPSKRETGMVVPTWNYAVVHAWGPLVVHDDAEWLRAFVTRLTDTHEAASKVPWQVTDAPADFIAKMLPAIVGIEIPIRRIEGKWKVSQNRPGPDREGTIAGLHGVGTPQANGMADLVAAAHQAMRAPSITTKGR